MCGVRWISILLLGCVSAAVQAEVIDEPDSQEPALYANVEAEDAIEPAELPSSSDEAGDIGMPAPALWAPLPQAEGDAGQVSAGSPEIAEMSATPRRFRYELTVEVRGVHDDNITLSHDNQKSDLYGQLSAEITAGIGDVLETDENYLSLSYTPTGYLFADHSEFNTVEHIARLEGQWRLSRLTLTLGQDVRSIQSANLDVATTTGGVVNETNLDVGGRRRLNTYHTHLDAEYELTGKTSARAEVDFSSRDYEELIGSNTLSGGLGIDYVYGPKLRVGVIGRAGKDFVDSPSPDQTFQDANVRFDYAVTGKFRATGSAGVQFRQSADSESTRVAPIFSAGLTYTPFDATEVVFSARSQTYNSASLVGRDFTSTQFVLRARQRFFQRLYLSLVTGFQNQSYFSTIGGVAAEREDNYFFVAPGIDYEVARFWSAGVYYLHRENDSSTELFGFKDNQVGIRSMFRF